MGKYRTDVSATRDSSCLRTACLVGTWTNVPKIRSFVCTVDVETPRVPTSANVKPGESKLSENLLMLFWTTCWLLRYVHSSDGGYCMDENECALLPNACGDHGRCVNTEGSYSCICGPGDSILPRYFCIIGITDSLFRLPTKFKWEELLGH